MKKELTRDSNPDAMTTTAGFQLRTLLTQVPWNCTKPISPSKGYAHPLLKK
jgi:hypothetical protein